MTEYLDTVDSDEGLWYKRLMPGYSVMGQEELPKGVKVGLRYLTVGMNPVFLLPWLRGRLEGRGVGFVRSVVNSLDEASQITGDRIVVNASGVGARELADDEAVRPVRGQTLFLKTAFEEMVMLEGTEYTYVIPRAGSGGVIMGGIKSDRLDADVDLELRDDILARVKRITGKTFEDVEIGKEDVVMEDIVGFRPGRKGGLRVDREGDVVHAYGAEGAGYIYSFGVAERVRFLVEEDRRAKL